MTVNTLCSICQSKSGIYKCPKCRIKYCSVVCFKSHKDSDCEPIKEVVEEQQITQEYQYSTRQTVPLDKLKELEHDEELKEILRNPHVRKILSSIDEMEDPSDIIKEAMQEPIFVEFADACLRIVEPKTTDQSDV